jgi:hypothetical protein
MKTSFSVCQTAKRVNNGIPYPREFEKGDEAQSFRGVSGGFALRSEDSETKIAWRTAFPTNVSANGESLRVP